MNKGRKPDFTGADLIAENEKLTYDWYNQRDLPQSNAPIIEDQAKNKPKDAEKEPKSAEQVRDQYTKELLSEWIKQVKKEIK